MIFQDRESQNVVTGITIGFALGLIIYFSLTWLGINFGGRDTWFFGLGGTGGIIGIMYNSFKATKPKSN